MRKPHSISTTLLARIRQQEPEAWQRFVDLFGPTVYRWCRAAGIEKNEAGDVAQEVFLAVAKNVDRFDREKGSGSFTAWMASITRNKIHDHFRRLAKLPVCTWRNDCTNVHRPSCLMPKYQIRFPRDEIFQAQKKLPRRANGTGSSRV